jgi:DNA-binding transcriptional LysR family regulator
MPYLEKFHNNYPNIDIQIVNNLTNELLSLLRNGSLDMLLLNLPMKENKDINIIPVMDVHDIFVGNKKYFDLTKGHLKLEELKNDPLLFQKLPSNTRTYLDNYLKDNKVNLIPKMEIVSYNLIMDFIKIGFGIGYATKEFIQDELINKTLYEIKVTPTVPKRYIGIVTMKQTIPNYSVKKLMDMMCNNKKS